MYKFDTGRHLVSSFFLVPTEFTCVVSFYKLDSPLGGFAFISIFGRPVRTPPVETGCISHCKYVSRKRVII